MQRDPSNEPETPDAGRKQRWYYGWTIVSVVSVVSFAGGVETNPVLGVFQDPITSEFGWSRAAFTLPMSIGTFAGGIAAVALGPIMDRHGSRWVMAIAIILMGLIFVGIGAMESYWQHFALQFLGRTVVASTFFLIVGVVIPKWFVVKRGRAIGVAAFGQRIGHATFPIMIERIMAFSNWRVAAISMGVTVWVTALLPTLLFMRRRPEDMGLRPDGAMPDLRTASDSASSAPRTAPREEVSFSRKEALRAPAFYFLMGALASQSFVATGVNFHWFSYLTGNGVSTSGTVFSLALAPVVGMPAAVVGGFIAEKVPPQLVLAAAYVLMSVSIGVLLITDTTAMAILFGVLYGGASGIMITNNQVIWADFFGRGSIGAIRGLISPLQMFTNALGPVVAAFSYDATGSYRSIFAIGVVVLLGSAALAAAAKRPTRR